MSVCVCGGVLMTHWELKCEIFPEVLQDRGERGREVVYTYWSS